ncbi:IS66-like element accessory protein TnpA [Pusillimonas minor]|uniref:Transposase n=1 Tax=Pusillimonas minor TaxID=2697024 RepID=A0A842HSH3_9BURK|nr:transposase [Pusillimonas minor]MBC2771203.1 transposase [Pusillimonas minor]
MSEFSASLVPVPSGYRRRYTVDFKRQVVQESMASGASIAGVAMAHGLNANQLHNWRWQFRRGAFGPITEGPVLLPVQIKAVSAQAQPQPAKIIDGQDRGVSSGHIELIFPGARVVVHGTADLPTLRCLVQALRE